jgi:hypothetical protein
MQLQSGKRKRQRVLETVEKQLMTMMASTHKQKRWKGPSVGEFWILRPDSTLRQLGCRFLIVRVVSNDRRARTSKVQGWSHSGNDASSLVSTLQSRFTKDVDGDAALGALDDDIHWDQNGWKCVVLMRHFKSFCRMLNVSDIHYVAQQWATAS